MSNTNFLLRTFVPGSRRIKSNLCAVVFAFLICFAAIAVKAQSPLDGFDPNANGVVRVIIIQPDGKILIGGDFTSVAPNGGAAVARNHIARFNPNGTLDLAFDPNADASVSSLTVQADGKILAGGSFNVIGGQSRNYIARLDQTNGTADSFNPNASSNVYSIAVQPDGKVLTGGSFNVIGGQTRNHIARLDPNSGLADSLDPNANNNVGSLAVQADGRVLVGGQFTNIGGQPRNFIARLDTMSGAADSFNPNANSLIYSIAVQPDGKILAGGGFTTIGGQPRNHIARLDPNSGLADSLDPNASSFVSSLVVQPDGKILAGGGFTIIGGQPRNFIARLDSANGAADSFNPNANTLVNSIAVQSDGKVLAGGSFTSLTPNGGAAATTRNRIARFERDGRLDQTLNLNTVGSYVLATAIQPDGKIIIAGSFSSVLGAARNNIARLNTDGTLDQAFDPNASNVIYAITVQPDGKILLGGFFTTFSPNGGAAVTHNDIARLNSDGTPDAAFTANTNGGVYAITVQPDGKILLGGRFTELTPNGGAAVTRNYIARINSDGTIDAAFNPNASNFVYSIAAQSDGKVLLGGFFRSLAPNGGTAITRNYIARLNTDGTVDQSFDPNPGSFVFVITTQTDGKILLSGAFTALAPNGGAAVIRNHLVRLNTGGTVDQTFDPNADSSVSSIVLQSDGKILLGGSFTSFAPNGGAPVNRNRVARLNTDGTVDPAFDPNASFFVESIAVQSDGKILLGGEFSSLAPNGGAAISRSLFARLSNDTAALSSLTVTKTSVTLTRNGSAAQFTRVIFEQSLDNGATYTTLGTATGSFAATAVANRKSDGEQSAASAVQTSGYTLSGLNLPTGQNILIRARGFYRGGDNNGSEIVEDKVQNAYLPVTTAAGVSVGGRVRTSKGQGIIGVVITLTDMHGNSRSVMTSAFGNYRFADLKAGETYVVTAAAKRYSFGQSSQIVNATQNLDALNFTANP